MKEVTITHRHCWDMGHRLPLHDGKCARLHGHRYVAEIDICGPLLSSGPGTGMVLDFYHVKDVVASNIGFWDHRTMLFQGDSLAKKLEGSNMWTDLGIILVPHMPTAENIAIWAMEALQGGLDYKFAGSSEAVPRISRVRVYETPNGWAEVKA